MLPRQKLKATLAIDGDHYRLRLESAAYVRAAWIDFGALDVQVEDNLLDLLPGETRDIAVRGPVDLAALRGEGEDPQRSLAHVCHDLNSWICWKFSTRSWPLAAWPVRGIG